MQIIYYNPETNHTVVDLSGVKPKELIEQEFGPGFTEELTIDENSETYVIVDGKLIKTPL